MMRPQSVAGGRPSLKVNSCWIFLGNSLYAASQWGIVALLSKQASPAELGVLVYGLALATPVFILAQLQLRPIQATDVTGRFPFSTYLKLRILCIVLALSIVAGLVVIAHPTRPVLFTTLTVMGARAAESLSDLLYGALQQREMMAQQGLSLSLKAVLSFVLAAAGFRILHTALGVALGMFAAWGLLLLLYDVPVTLRILRRDGDTPRRGFEAGQIWRLLRLAIPLGIVMFLINLGVNIPRYFLETQSGMAALGIFAALAYVQVAGSTVMNAIGQTAAPRLAAHFRLNDPRNFRLLLGKLMLVSALIGAAGIVIAANWGAVILTLLYNSAYAQYSQAFTILLAGAAVGYMASGLGYGLTAADVFSQQVVSTTLSTVTLTVSCWLLIPQYGLTGAAVSMLLAAAVLFVANALLMMPIILAGLKPTTCPLPTDAPSAAGSAIEMI